MKLPTQKKLLREDLKGAPSWIQPVIDVLNSFMETVYQAMNKNMTFRENISCQIKELTYKTPASYPASVPNVTFVSNLKTKAVGVTVWQCYDKDTYIPAPGPVYVPWVENNGTIIVYPVLGLEPDKTYILRLLVV